MFGTREQVTEVRYLIGAATGWGGLPSDQAKYINIKPGLPAGQYKIEVPKDVPVGAFWSISLYNKEGFFQKNDLGAYNVNSVTAKKNADGTTTVHFGGCKDKRVNCLPLMEGWEYTVRLYKPGKEVQDGSWKFPALQPVKG